MYSKNGENSLTGMVKVEISSAVNHLPEDSKAAATPSLDSLFLNLAIGDGAERDILTENEMGFVRVRKKLVFEEGIPASKMAPVTPASSNPPPTCPIDIIDSDDVENTTKLHVLDIQTRKKASGLTNSVGVVSMDGEEVPSKNNSTWSPSQCEEEMYLTAVEEFPLL